MKAKIRQQGVTLPEMLTAVAITVIMLGASGMIFKSAAKTSGKAMALNNLMSQVRVATTQIDKDFAGFRADLPWAVIFEGYNNGNGTFERRDRLVFFANGDFNNLAGDFQSDTARIFYGQSVDRFYNQDTDPEVSDIEDHKLFDKRAWDTNNKPFVPEFPYQRVLCRKQKMMSSIFSIWTGNRIDYETSVLEYGPDSYWKNLGIGSSSPSFDTYMYEIYDPTIGILNSIIYSESFIRRPFFSDVYSVVTNTANGYSRTKYDDYKQLIYMLDDVTDFTVQVWWQPPGEAQARWYPNDNDLQLFRLNTGAMTVIDNQLSSTSTTSTNYLRFSDAANTVIYNGGNNTNSYFGVGSNLKARYVINPYVTTLSRSLAWCYNQLAVFSLENSGQPMPTAMKISFRLHDEARSHYPEGKRFEYVVRLPESK